MRMVSGDMKLPANSEPRVSLDQAADEASGAVIERQTLGTAYVAERHGRILFATDTPPSAFYLCQSAWLKRLAGNDIRLLQV